MIDCSLCSVEIEGTRWTSYFNASAVGVARISTEYTVCAGSHLLSSHAPIHALARERLDRVGVDVCPVFDEATPRKVASAGGLFDFVVRVFRITLQGF